MSAPQPSSTDLAREAKTLASELKTKIKSGDALDKDAEFLRKRLRICALKLLLVHPNTKEAKDAETYLWMQTSYQFISFYKQRIAVLDKKLYSPAAQNGPRDARRPDTNGQGGHVEYRKLLSRFRQFLAEEYKFYVRLLLRFRSQFGLAEVRAHLVRAEIISEDAEETMAEQNEADMLRLPDEQEIGLGVYDPAAGEKELRLATFAKLLVCLGDLARYREQYSDKGGRPRAGLEDGPPRRNQRGGRNGRNDVARARNYSRAQTIYEQARSLAPNDGNASHQLAILAAYQKDTFACLLNYYRALCVRQPYDTASDNLNVVLKKALDQYRASRDQRNDDNVANGVPKLRVDRLQEWVVVLHGIWYFDQDEHASQATKHARRILAELKSMVTDRILPSPLITDFLVLAFSALYKVRMVKDSAIRARKENLEPVVTAHILDLYRVLLDTGCKELTERAEENVAHQNDLAQRITAPLRRMLPAMRVASKWLRTSANFVESLHTAESSPPFFNRALSNFWKAYSSFATSLKAAFPAESLPNLERPLEEDVDLVGFSAIRRNMFLSVPFGAHGQAEDVAEVHPNEEYLMRISDLLKDGELIASLDKTPVSIHSGVFISSTQNSEESADAAREVPRPMAAAIATVTPALLDEEAVSDTDDEQRTELTSGTDDIVRDAFNVALNGETDDNDDEEQIVWDPNPQPRPPASLLTPPTAATIMPPQGVIGSPHVTTPKQLSVVPEPPSSRFPPMPSLQPQPQAPLSPVMNGTTALDLLNNVLGGSRVRRDSAPPSNQQFVRSPPFANAAPASHLPPTNLHLNQNGQPQQSSTLFGQGTLHSPTTRSIWGSSDLSAPQQNLLHTQNAQQELTPSRYGQHLGVGLPQHLAPGHERARSLSLSQAAHNAHNPSSQITGSQDSIFGSLGLVPNAGVPHNSLNNVYSQQTGLSMNHDLHGVGQSQIVFEGQGIGQFTRAPGAPPPQHNPLLMHGTNALRPGHSQGQERALSMSNLGLGGANGVAFGFDERQGLMDPSISLHRSIWNAG